MAGQEAKNRCTPAPPAGTGAREETRYLYRAYLQCGAPIAAHSTSTTRTRRPTRACARAANIVAVPQRGAAAPWTPAQTTQCSFARYQATASSLTTCAAQLRAQ